MRRKATMKIRRNPKFPFYSHDPKMYLVYCPYCFLSAKYSVLNCMMAVLYRRPKSATCSMPSSNTLAILTVEQRSQRFMPTCEYFQSKQRYSDKNKITVEKSSMEISGKNSDLVSRYEIMRRFIGYSPFRDIAP